MAFIKVVTFHRVKFKKSLNYFAHQLDEVIDSIYNARIQPERAHFIPPSTAYFFKNKRYNFSSFLSTGARK